MKPPVLADEGFLFASGSVVPTDGDSGYQPGCIFQHTDGTSGTVLYVNEGTYASCDFNAVGALAATDIDAGASGTAGTVDVYAGTAASGKFRLAADDQDADTMVTLKPAGMGQATVVSIPDPGAATANVLLTDQANDRAVVTATAAELNVLDGVTAGTVTASKGLVVSAAKALDMLGLSAGAATPAVALRLGASATEGLEIKVYDETLDLTNAVAVDTNCVLPAGAVILSVQGNLEKAVTGDASGDNLLADIGIGISGGDEDAYAEFSALTKNAKADGIPDWAVLSAETTIAIFGLKVDGDTACTEKFTADTEAVRVRVVYAVCNSLDNAA
jgi:hypothetical protein